MELATGEFPYKNCKTDFEVLTKVLQEDPPLLPPGAEFSHGFCSFVRDWYVSKPSYKSTICFATLSLPVLSSLRRTDNAYLHTLFKLLYGVTHWKPLPCNRFDLAGSLLQYEIVFIWNSVPCKWTWIEYICCKIWLFRHLIDLLIYRHCEWN